MLSCDYGGGLGLGQNNSTKGCYTCGLDPALRRNHGVSD